MADLPQIDEIQALLHPSKPTSDRSFAYESLLRLQQVSADDPSLAARSRLLLPLVLSDIRSHDEETSAQALKCLGFMIYHPMHVASIPEMEAHLVVEALVELITTTKMKVGIGKRVFFSFLFF
ncbi:hypothetical protein QJS04_geneDACA001527 [Acorus gramineus]|uniref:Uncharacterized protein n=1 Tax=Acorus gramineus TaxID=55184 RepID=A0AAV9BG92_ACOGR|nr:hypothetical protein QJS04_geneDACA001527 [Acorus gramineus]